MAKAKAAKKEQPAKRLEATLWEAADRPTAPTNLTNVCAGCNYTRGNNSMDAAGIAEYDRPAEELRSA
jgi:hypothetical protein